MGLVISYQFLEQLQELKMLKLKIIKFQKKIAYVIPDIYSLSFFYKLQEFIDRQQQNYQHIKKNYKQDLHSSLMTLQY